MMLMQFMVIMLTLRILIKQINVGDVGRPQHQVQEAPHVSELEAEPLSLSTLGIFLNIVLLFL